MKILVYPFIILSLFIFSLPLAGAKVESPFQVELEETMTCLCGCGQSIKSCPHQNCGFAIPAKAKIKDLVSEGKSVSEILDIFMKQYGEEILSAPTKKGFNLLGYLLPFFALIIAGILIFFALKKWSSDGVKDEEKTLPMAKEDFGSTIDKQIEKELEEMD